MIFSGYEFTESKQSIESIEGIVAHVAIFLIGWEERSFSLLKASAVSGKKAIIVRFLDDGLSESDVYMAIKLAREKFSEVELYNIHSSLDKGEWESRLSSLIVGLSAEDEFLTCFIDYTSIPKAVTQTMYRMLLQQNTFPRTVWGYCEGLYSNVEGNTRIDQGVSGGFFPIRFTPGKGGTSGERTVILALGADEKLIEELLENSVYDQIHVLTPKSKGSADLEKTTELQIKRLRREFHISTENFHEVDASSVSDCVVVFNDIIRNISAEGAIDIFCSGPKTHAVAACVIAEKYNRNVSLLGRIPSKYGKFEVKPSGNVSISCVTNFCDPLVRFIL